jgi:hypothetical protein
MLRAHGLIQKVSHTHRHHVTGAGRAILIAVLTTARTSVHQPNRDAQWHGLQGVVLFPGNRDS